jgi:phosphohistidine phosphatase
MHVYLVQHGEAKSEEEDPQRRLTNKGIGEVQNVAMVLRSLKLAVDAIWHSDKARAQQTGELLAGRSGRGMVSYSAKALAQMLHG